ncbi:transposase [Cryobacterium sp. CAN_C3]|uniref:transposase n=1 Tax=unclassified Cryobacterium TaxID=2649013 RepID=UPI0018C8F119
MPLTTRPSQSGAPRSRNAIGPLIRKRRKAPIQFGLLPLLPSSAGRAGRPFVDDRRVVEGITYRYRCGIAWRDMSTELGPWQTLWKRHRRHVGDGTWDRVLARLLTTAEDRGVVDWAVSVALLVSRAPQPDSTES